MKPTTANPLALLKIVFFMSIKVSLVDMVTVVCWGAILLLNSPMNPPKAPPTMKLRHDLKTQLSVTATIINSGFCCILAGPADWGTMILG